MIHCPREKYCGLFVLDHFYKLNDKKFEGMFLDGVVEMKAMQEKLKLQLDAMVKQRDRFKEMYFKLCQSAQN